MARRAGLKGPTISHRRMSLEAKAHIKTLISGEGVVLMGVVGRAMIERFFFLKPQKAMFLLLGLLLAVGF